MSTPGFEHLKVLIVEDNQHMRGLLRSLLSTLDIHNPMDAANGNVALELLQDRKCDLILTDLAMKPMDGIEFTRQVRNGKSSPNPYVPIIMITGHTEMHHVRAARDAGITEFMAKPITAQALFTHIAQIVERPRPFVRCEGYFGPDRRRRNWENYAGPWRRAGDYQIVKNP